MIRKEILRKWKKNIILILQDAISSDLPFLEWQGRPHRYFLNLMIEISLLFKIKIDYVRL